MQYHYQFTSLIKSLLDVTAKSGEASQPSMKAICVIGTAVDMVETTPSFQHIQLPDQTEFDSVSNKINLYYCNDQECVDVL